MNESIILSEDVKAYFSSHASLAALGRQVSKLRVFEPIAQNVKITQKTVKYRPSEKLMDAFISLLAGAQGLVEINKCLKADVGLQRAFGRTGCAEQPRTEVPCGAIGGARYLGCLHGGEREPNPSSDGSDLSTPQPDLSP